MELLSIIGREEQLFAEDIRNHEIELAEIVATSSFLVLGGAGSIGQAVVKELFRRKPRQLHVVDLSENNLAELVRDIRSSLGYIPGDFQTYCLDIGSVEYGAFIASGGRYDYVLNLSAMKHVRSERDPFTLMRLIEVNVTNTEKTLKQCVSGDTKKYFCVSTDKAANPVNMMGASKRIMEHFLMRASEDLPVSTSRFANVAFSDGSLLHSFRQRIEKRQPIVAPRDIKRYFVTPREAAELCLMSCILGENRDIFFPKPGSRLPLVSMAEVAMRFLHSMDYEAVSCDTEEEARQMKVQLHGKKSWPCYFSNSDTTGEKDFEEFFTESETIDWQRFDDVGVIRNTANYESARLDEFLVSVTRLRNSGSWSKEELVALFRSVLPEFMHKETGKYLDSKM